MKNIFRKVRNYIFSFKTKIFNKMFGHSVILLYHRVADVCDDPFKLSVSIKNFRQQIKFLSEKYKIIPLSELIEKLKNKKLQKNEISLTFDDGYADNLYNVLPILEEFSSPATVFITSGMIGKKEPYYWDKATSKEDRGRSMLLEELKTLSRSPLIEIGTHTENHPLLSSLIIEKQEEEIKNSKKMIEIMIGKEIKGFAYPFGSINSFSKETVQRVKKSGFEFACSTRAMRVFNFSNIYAVPRIIIRNWNVEELISNLKEK